MTAPTLDPQTVKRLAFIRLLYQQGVEQSYRAEPLAFTSILSFHDAVELFLVLAGEHLRATLDLRIDFLKYWKALSPTATPNGVALSGSVGMDRLNRLRTGFKHTGALPGRAAVEQARADARNFFEDNTPKVFNVEFSAVDMADLVVDAEIRGKIKDAMQADLSGDRHEGMALLVEAFDGLFNADAGLRGATQSPLSFGGRIQFPLRKDDIREILWRPDNDPRARRLPVRGAEKLAEQIHHATGVAGQLQDAVRIMVLGIDFYQYQRFRRLTPAVYWMMNGERRCNYPQNYTPSQEEFDFCHEFVVSAAIRYAELDPHRRPPSWTAKNSDAQP